MISDPKKYSENAAQLAVDELIEKGMPRDFDGLIRYAVRHAVRDAIEDATSELEV